MSVLRMAAPLIATLLGLFGFTVMAMEQIVAHNESGARVDALTGLLNRGALEMSALQLVARWQRDATVALHFFAPSRIRRNTIVSADAPRFTSW